MGGVVFPRSERHVAVSSNFTRVSASEASRPILCAVVFWFFPLLNKRNFFQFVITNILTTLLDPYPQRALIRSASPNPKVLSREAYCATLLIIEPS